MTAEEKLLPSTRVARGATAVFMKSIAGTPLGLLYIAILTRLIPPKEMGILAILGFFTSILTVIGDLGLSGASSKFIPEFLGRGEIPRALGIYRKILLMSTISAVTILVLLLPLSPYLSLFLTRSSGYVLLVASAIISIPIAILFNVLLSFVQSFQRMKEYAALSFTQLNAGRFLGLILLALGFGLAGIFYDSIVAGLLALALLILVLRKYLKMYGDKASNHPSDFQTGKLLGFSLPLLGVGLLGVLLGWIDSIFIWAKLPISELGVYQAAATIYSFLLILPQALSTSLYPQISELYGKHGKGSLGEVFNTTSRYIFLIYVPLVFAAILFSKQIIAILTGPQYSEANLPFTIMTFGAFAGGFIIILNLNFMTLGKTWQFLSLQVASFTAYLSILSFLVPVMGIEGAALSKTIIAFFTMLLTLLVLRRYIPVNFDHEGCLKSFISSFIASAAILPLTTFSSSLTLFPLHLSLFVAIYLLALAALKSIREQDLTRVEAFLPARARFMVKYLRRFAR